jgi:hypothetical protein
VKKSICLSFPDYIFDPKCLPTPQRSLIGHPRAIFCTQISEQISKWIFSHLPDGLELCRGKVWWSWECDGQTGAVIQRKKGGRAALSEVPFPSGQQISKGFSRRNTG